MYILSTGENDSPLTNFFSRARLNKQNILEKETFIFNTMKRLEENQIDKLEFIKIISYKFLPVS